MACISPLNNWQKNPIYAAEAGKIFEKWLLESKGVADNNLLLICGAGISMSGVAPGPPGKVLGDVFANYLRAKSCAIPASLNGDVARLYEHYCYCLDLDATNPMFDASKHMEFSTSIRSASFMNGIPNYSHLTLEKEVRNCNNKSVRVYSANVDQFFDQAAISPTLIPLWGDNMINAADLKGRVAGCNEHRNWEMLAAHGQISKGFSVWSDTALSMPVSNIPAPYSIERDILSSALECVRHGPLYRYIIFAGICAPLTYLMETLAEHLIDTDYRWLWINPYDYPQEWLLNFPKFNHGNGEWVKSIFDDVCLNMHLRRYIAWINTSCQCDKYDYDSCVMQPDRGRKDIVKGIHRARRLFKEGATVLHDGVKNPGKLEEYHKCDYPYDPPSMVANAQFEDHSLAKTLSGFYERNLRITPDPGDQYPRCSICVNPKTSVQMINIDSKINLEEIVEGIVMTVSECYWDTGDDPDLLIL